MYKRLCDRFPACRKPESKTLSLVCVNGSWWVQSNWCGNIVRPWDIPGILWMLWDFRLKPLW